MSWHVYLLECADRTLYCGVTRDLARRLDQHNGLAPGGARYTRPRRPVRLAASLPCPDRSEACRLEARIKRLPRGRKLAFLLGLAAQNGKEQLPTQEQGLPDEEENRSGAAENCPPENTIVFSILVCS